MDPRGPTHGGGSLKRDQQDGCEKSVILPDEGDSEDAISTDTDDGSPAANLSDSETGNGRSRVPSSGSASPEDMVDAAADVDVGGGGAAEGPQNVAVSIKEDDDDEDGKSKAPTNKCEYCGNEFVTPAGLKTHIRLRHSDAAFHHFECKLFKEQGYQCKGGECMRSGKEMLAHFHKYHTEKEVRCRNNHVIQKFRFLKQSKSPKAGPLRKKGSAGQNQPGEETGENEDQVEEDEAALPEQVGNKSGKEDDGALSMPDIKGGHGLDDSIAGIKRLLPTLEAELSVLRNEKDELALKLKESEASREADKTRIINFETEMEEAKQKFLEEKAELAKKYETDFGKVATEKEAALQELKESEDKRQADQTRFNNVNGEKNKLIEKYVNDLEKVGAEKAAALQERRVAVHEKRTLEEEAQKLKDQLQKMEAEHAEQLQQIFTQMDKDIEEEAERLKKKRSSARNMMVTLKRSKMEVDETGEEN